MVMFQMFHVGNCRSVHLSVVSKSPWSNPFLLLATAGSLAIHVGALHLPAAQFVLRVEPLDLGTWMRLTAVATSIVVAMEIHKAVRRTKVRPSGGHEIADARKAGW